MLITSSYEKSGQNNYKPHRDYKDLRSKSNPEEHPNLNKKLRENNVSKGNRTFMKLQSRLYSQDSPHKWQNSITVTQL